MERMQGYITKSAGWKGRDLVKALHSAFHECESDFIAIAGREGLRDGTTAVVALVEAKTLTIAHVGDSRGVLCRAGGETVAVTQDHKPELEPERRRIEALGGFVSHIGCWRAMGILAMSRAIGDLFLKPYVSAEPEVSSMPLQDTDEFVVLASDGVFDVFDNEQVVQIVQSASSPQEAANLLTHSAFVAGSLDNVTAVVVALRGYKPAPQAARSLVEPSMALSGSLQAAILAVRRGGCRTVLARPVRVHAHVACSRAPSSLVRPLPSCAGGLARGGASRLARRMRKRSARLQATSSPLGARRPATTLLQLTSSSGQPLYSGRRRPPTRTVRPALGAGPFTGSATLERSPRSGMKFFIKRSRRAARASAHTRRRENA